MRIFVAGIMQGSHLGAVIHNQDYRGRILAMLARHLPDADVYDPLADHSNSLEYSDEQGREVFFHHCRLCREVDAVLAFVPEASMGTAVEMWEAWQHGRAVITVSPMRHNWAVRFLSHAVFHELDEFEAALAGGRVREIIEHTMRQRQQSAATENDGPILGA